MSQSSPPSPCSPLPPCRSTWVGRSVIRSCGKLAYPMVQSMIDGEYLARPGEEPPCELHGDATWQQASRGGRAGRAGGRAGARAGAVLSQPAWEERSRQRAACTAL